MALNLGSVTTGIDQGRKTASAGNTAINAPFIKLDGNVQVTGGLMAGMTGGTMT